MNNPRPNEESRPFDPHRRHDLLRYRAYFDCSSSGVYILDTAGQLIDVNPAACRLHERTREEMLAMLPSEFIAPESHDALDDFRNTVMDGRTYTGYARGLKRDGTRFDAAIEGHLISIEGAQYLFLTVADVTELRNKDSALRSSQELYRTVVEDQEEFIVRWQPDGTRTFVNPAYARFFNREPGELLGTSFLPRIPEEDRAALLERISKLTPESPYSSAENRVMGPDGALEWQQWTDRAFFDSNRELIGLQSTGRVITKQKHAEAEVQRRLTLQTLLANASTHLLASTEEESADRLAEAIATFCEHFRLDLMECWHVHMENRVVERTSRWSRDGTDPGPGLHEFDSLPWVTKELIASKVIRISDRREFPPEARKEAALADQLGVRALLILPFAIGSSRGFGVIARFDQPHEWTDQEVEEIELALRVAATSDARFRAESLLRKREQELDRAQAVAKVGSFVFDLVKDRAVLSDHAAAILGIKSYTKHFLECVHPEDRSRASAFIKESLKSKNEFSQEYRVLHDDGAILHVLERSEVIRDGSGKAIEAIVTILDVTEDREREQQLAQALEEVRRLKERVEAENVYLRDEVRQAQGMHDIVGESESIRRCLMDLERVAPTDATVLVQGETGTGKELVARALHERSHRASGPFICVNCGAFPATLIESELFGHEKGAFTGAERAKLGCFELASGGTLFLDEVGEMPLELQSKLLRAIQEGEIQRLGAEKATAVDVRLVAASNRDLAKSVDDGTFRSDLYYRLNVVPIHVPPLRERPEDIPILAKHFVRKLAPGLRREVQGISVGTLRRLKEHRWPGNIRELENVIERALIASSGTTLHVDQLGSASVPPDTETPAAWLSLEEVEREHIRHVAAAANWKLEGVGGAAARLGLRPSTLRSRMRKLGISRPERR